MEPGGARLCLVGGDFVGQAHRIQLAGDTNRILRVEIVEEQGQLRRGEARGQEDEEYDQTDRKPRRGGQPPCAQVFYCFKKSIQRALPIPLASLYLAFSCTPYN